MPNHDDYNDIREKRFSKEKKLQQDRVIMLEAENIRNMQESLSVAVTQFMASEGIGVSELAERLEIESELAARILEGEANTTLATLANIAALMDKEAKIVFE